MFRKILRLWARFEDQERRLDAIARCVASGVDFSLTKRGYAKVSDKCFARVYPNGCADPEITEF